MRRRLAGASLLALLAATPLAVAQQRPITIPTRDVDVTYHMAGPANEQLTQRMRWLAAQQVLRVDPPTPGLYMLEDYRAHHMQIVREPTRQVIDINATAASFPGGTAGPNGGTYTRGSDDRIAGIPCTNWETRDAASEPTTVCFTADGVMLRAQSGGRTLVEAVSVQYGPQDPAAFRVPDGYTHMQQPAQ
jgi:hypothetical protein